MKKSEKKKGKNQKLANQNSTQVLTSDEIHFLKQLYADSQIIKESAAGQEAFVVPQYSGEKKRTSLSVYHKQWDRWNAFKEKYSMHSGTDLMAMALDEFMAKYDDSDE